jgi:hypothetical protein
MAIISKSEMEPRKIFTIDLTGPEGNVFYLMSQVRVLGRITGLSQDEVSNIQSEMMSADYENAVRVFDREFGSFVILYR